MNLRCAALNTGPDTHLLDHIAPLAALLKMPLLATEELNYTLALRYYPQVETLYAPDLEHNLSALAATYDVLFECKYWAPHLQLLFQQLFHKKMRLVFCPHGQSDKGYQTPLLAPYAQQDMVLLYGDLLAEMLKELNLPVPHAPILGNHRLAFYLQHRAFYDDIAEREIFSKLPSAKTLLYAPTWKDADSATSFFSQCAAVISQLPPDWNLLIKPHPLLEQRDPARFYSIAALAEKKENVLMLADFPPVYPVLSRVDCYLGDASSVGYDMLYFEKPLYFFPSAAVRLHTCGEIIHSPQDLFRKPLQNNYKAQQKALYARAFAPITQEQARKNILEKLVSA